MIKILRILKCFFLIIVFLLLGAIIFIYIDFRLSLPTAGGSIKIAGLQSEVTVSWDRWGVPHIRAENEGDLFFAVGYVQAQQRMWQMELLRRTATGRASEILGKPALKQDRQARVVGLSMAIEKDYEQMSGEIKQLARAYARGINTWLEERKWNWPPELVVLRVRPEPWRVEDSLAIKQVLALSLAADFSSEISRMKLVKKLGPKALDLLEEGIDFLPDSSIKLDFLHLGWQQGDILQGSNNWVVSGKLSQSGKPLLANDPHLMITVPPIWMEMSLECPGFKAAGVTLPGVPLVVIGHNEKIAWGVTSSYADVQDLYFEKVEWQNNTYLRKGEWKSLTTRKEVIKVRGRKDPEVMDILWTEEGPILTPFLITCELPISLRWTIYDGDRTFEGLYLINKAGNWQEFCQGVRFFDNPSQNFVYADVEGNIGYYLSGKIPIRKKEAAVYPYPGWKEDSQWQGYLREEEKPNLFNPEKGYIITANSSIIPDGYQPYISFDWLAPYRKDRIEELIKTGGGHSIDSFIKIQNDVFSKRAEQVLKIVREIKLTDPKAEEARRIIEQWSGEIRGGLAPALFEVFWKKMEELTFGDELGVDLQDASRYFRVKEAGLKRILANPDSPWFDRIDSQERENRDEIIKQALIAALNEMRKKAGKNPGKWDWAKMHSLNYQHILGQKSPLSFFNCGDYPMIGDATTVRASFGNDGWKTSGGPSCRLIIDLSDLDDSLAVISSGQSGHFMSKHYRDQIPLYLNSLYHPLAFSAEAVQKVEEKVMKLVPKDKAKSKGK
jgi:penicillin amidase